MARLDVIIRCTIYLEETNCRDIKELSDLIDDSELTLIIDNSIDTEELSLENVIIEEDE
jgi:hypothetical protein